MARRELTAKEKDRVEHIFEFMEWDHLTGSELEYVESFETQYKKFDSLSERQVEVLESIFQKAAERA